MRVLACYQASRLLRFSAGVWGHTSNPDGFAGFFTGRGYFTDEVGIGRNPTTKLDVAD